MELAHTGGSLLLLLCCCCGGGGGGVGGVGGDCSMLKHVEQLLTLPVRVGIRRKCLRPGSCNPERAFGHLPCVFCPCAVPCNPCGILSLGRVMQEGFGLLKVLTQHPSGRREEVESSIIRLAADNKRACDGSYL